MMSGSYWLPLMNPITRRPVASRITPSKRARKVLELHALLDHRLPAATVEERLLPAREALRNRQTTRSSSWAPWSFVEDVLIAA